MRKSLRKSLSVFVGPGGWRSVAGPAAFAFLGLVLVVFDHFQHRINAVPFWLTVALIACVFLWLVGNARKQSWALEEVHRKAMSDEVTGLEHDLKLRADIAADLAAGRRKVLVLLEFDGVHDYYDRFGHAAGDELARRIAQRLGDGIAPLAGVAYRIDANRFAVLAPAEGRQLGEVVLAATGSLHEDDQDLPVGRSYGEVTLPDDTDDPERAFQVAGQRLAARKQQQRRSARRQAHAVLMAVLSARQPQRRDHLRAVAYRAIALGRRLDLGQEEIDDIALAAELQDVGLLAVPESTLEKSTHLNEGEIETIRHHSVVGSQIIGAAPGLASVANIVGAASERFDGSGYPDGLAGEAIPLGSRIIAVAAAFTAITSSRPHRSVGTVEEALDELRRGAGTQFDPSVVSALADEITDEGLLGAPVFSSASTA